MILFFFSTEDCTRNIEEENLHMESQTVNYYEKK